MYLSAIELVHARIDMRPEGLFRSMLAFIGHARCLCISILERVKS